MSVTATAERPDADALARSHAGLARSLARRAARGLPWLADELESAAMDGLRFAISRFDPTRGAEFATYATHRIAGAILDAKQREFPRGYGRLHRGSRPRLVSLYDVADEDGRTHAALAVDHREGPPASDAIERATVGLAPRERAVILAIYRDGLNQSEAGRRAGVSQSRTSQLHDLAIERLREDPRAVGRLLGEPFPDPPAWRRRRPDRPAEGATMGEADGTTSGPDPATTTAPAAAGPDTAGDELDAMRAVSLLPAAARARAVAWLWAQFGEGRS
jgi:RNA polymerase sigma factor (sigma-70 family)